ncbi:MAG: 50S ribosomal protein L23 [Candidatus Nomurabacteria bacterium GW2011_GWA2_40_9]|uniref:Large ribosomal subunit protein uL23 n=1 Tax=Candidatus Nomurabacteria bacterium GW2011_GWA2_40_9 TaxID=1618734 RepID=A0A0G0W5Y6_9BACT|nr:MAG: 50S ribosomal protein L23 [Candidatus Nomurabacteria bacterium GW2011_GWA2_40_9]
MTIIITKIIKNPRITEKASGAAEANVYTFDVTANANKTEIKKAIFALYKMKPVKVNVLTVPKKNIVVRGKKGVKQGGKKALIYLKKGDKIEVL